MPKPEPLPPIYVDLVRASDTFVNLYPKDALAPAIAYKAAESYYVFNEFDEARCRFKDIITRYPTRRGGPVRGQPHHRDLPRHQGLGQRDGRDRRAAAAGAAWSRRDPSSRRPWSSSSWPASSSWPSRRWTPATTIAAAALFIELVQKDPQNEFADKALNNAAVCYENMRRFDSALRTYERIITEYPKSTLADQAVFRVASDAEQSYDFDKAVSRYLLLVDHYPNSKNRAGALYNAARLLEGLQRYPEAAAAYKRYAELFPDEPDAPQNLFRAALGVREAEGLRRGDQGLSGVRQEVRQGQGAGRADGSGAAEDGAGLRGAGASTRSG